MNSAGVLGRLWKHLRPALYAATGGIIFAAPVPLVLMISWMGATEGLREHVLDAPSAGNLIFGIFWMGLVAFGVGVMYLLVVGFPALLLLWLMQLRHPVFPTLIAGLISFVSSRPGDRVLWVLFGLSTGLIAGIYARRCGLDALQRWKE